MADKNTNVPNKNDFISREAAKAKKVYSRERRENVIPVAEIDWLPAADVVEVVRCKDCINWNGNDCITMHGLSAPRPNDYCSRGEREPDKEDWGTTLDWFKTKMKAFFDEAQSKEAG